MTTVYERRAAPAVAPPARRSPAGVVLALLWAGAAAVLALWWSDTGSVVGAAGWLTGAGRIAGLLCGYACAVLVGLMARVPLLERRIGSDRVARWHAMAGRYTVSLLLAHIGLILAGYAAQDGASLWHETLTVVLDYPEMLKATAGTVILLAVGLTSARAVRRRTSHEFWYYVHLLTYAAVFLSFGHQLALGNDFNGNTAATAAWYALYLGVAALVLWFRILAPVRLNLRHRLRVESVHREAPGVWSVVVRGRRLDELGAQAGQFFRWRFLGEGMGWTSTPYSLSAPPRRDRMRITVKALGDHSTAVALLRPGTRVWAEGPYGSLTADRQSSPKSLLVAAGVGITPMRALFETLPGEVTLLYRARTAEDLALGGELEALARWRGAKVLYALNGPDGRRPDLTARSLRSAVPDLAGHDVYICGPHGFARDLYEELRAAGVPDRRIHHESFEL
ncbi:ferredoxin-NADP reductase/DMSO/TMAO reductase YedYZ heme-binding membrane subunit [Streptomyces sp. SAI-135]|uniref:ferredoxin reductase family protein n=1 Tax=unclassified Streptomyces TaxID=2593676 RepID=UPI002474C8D8|nr:MULTISPECIES: ferredoxin reductase family protein [unclassified Streptomyces]MDH6520340.1 ferredoxin-NADP reductase/DMSO/TMAO reductase YedYZ heme-binding membrane subunit [Streptomyces sp. SAI-090]MDH6552555.1 ferredoxin-NADP reductase/DMSO/TMAO reductase YedYZ heme-binding membrane subunit [Streptomyces sp. SAI-041]MDH6615570.1 ferredoxin-NADP reductase/DMSO/TMAO reductase YedYZ heme-binding membrane subunit [Streptomyces sp. SAI-135]